MNLDDLFNQLREFPEPLVDQVQDYVDFLASRKAVPEESAADRFWRKIGLINWEADSQEEAVAPLLANLTSSSIEEIYGYQDQLAIHLSDLDGPDFFDAFAKGPLGASVDSFLYGRCYVVAKGRTFYENILKNPGKFPPGVDFETLLYLENEAYEAKMGEEMTRFSPVVFETAFNKKNWGERAISYA